MEEREREEGRKEKEREMKWRKEKAETGRKSKEKKRYGIFYSVQNVLAARKGEVKERDWAGTRDLWPAPSLCSPLAENAFTVLNE